MSGPFKALLLDEADVFIGIVQLESEAQLTDRHIDLRPFGGDCDLQPGQYRWDRQRCALLPLPKFRRRPVNDVPTLEECVYALATGGKSAPEVQRWVTWFEASMDKRRARRDRK